MQDWPDNELLAEYLKNDSEEAFATLVARHVNKVYSVAIRHVGNPHHAEEITQAVFIILLKKARALHKDTILSGWLYHTARLTAVTFLRSEIRRSRREQEAQMETLLNQSDENAWQQLAPLLDDAIAKLGTTDRNAIVLRFFDGKSMREVGAGLGISEDTAAKRISRAVQKLRAFFARRGVVLSTTAICGAISTNSVLSAPALVSTSVVSAALSGSTLSSSTGALVKEALDLLVWLKLKTAFTVIGVALAIAGGAAGTVALEKRNLTAAKILERTQQTYSGLSSYNDTWRSVAYLGTTQIFDSVLHSNQMMLGRPLFYRIESADSGPGSSTAIWSAGDGDFWSMVGGHSQHQRITATNSVPEFHVAFPSTPIPCSFFDKRDWDSLPALAQASDLTRLADESIGVTDCYSVSATTKAPVFNITLWIAKNDFLIRQTRFVWMTGNPSGRRGSNGGDALGNPGRLTNTVIQIHENISVNRSIPAQQFAYKFSPRLEAVSEREMRADDPRYLDLDTGEFVQAHPPGDLFWSAVESVLQARAGANMTAIAVTAAQWSATAAEVVEALSKETPREQVRIGGSESKLEPGSKRMWFFRTSERSAGVLEIRPKNEITLVRDRAGQLQALPRTDSPGSVFIRWRLVQSPRRSNPAVTPAASASSNSQ
jgi:RNA polymerase sigma factor (sigma-70 family)